MIEKNDDNQIKTEGSEIANKINENIELKRNNEELKKELNKFRNVHDNLVKEKKQKEVQLQKLSNDYKMKIEEKDKEIQEMKKKFQKELNLILKEQTKKDEEIKRLKERLAKVEKEFNNYKKNKENRGDPLTNFKEPTLIGLNNTGDTSFMNPVLQCLSQTSFLTNFFLKE